MRTHLEAPIRRHWYGEGGLGGRILGILTSPASVLFGLGVRGRNLLYDRQLLSSSDPPLPVISVGNLAVGGTGKTPVSRWLMGRLLQMGRKPALVSRGYGADELLLHRRWHPQCPVIANRRRLTGAQEAAREGADVCVLDDGFQHRQLRRDLDVLLVSVQDPLPARLLPRGPYREPLGSLRRSHLVLVTSHGAKGRGEADRLVRRLGAFPGGPAVVSFPFVPGPWQRLNGAPAGAPTGRAVVVSSVARPDSVVAMAQEAGVSVDGALGFPDHHAYTGTDVDRIREQAGSRIVVTTEKDAVKLEAFRDRLPEVRVLTLATDPDPGVVRIVDEALEEALFRGDSRSRNPAPEAGERTS